MRGIKGLRRSLFISTALMSVALSHGAVAAETARLQIEEVVVTAQKREQNLADAPISITAFTSTQIENAGLGDLSEIGHFTPGLYWNNINVSKPQVFIRGLGTTAFDAGSDPSVAVFLDDTYIARFAGMSMEMLDIERIEVLKGPQGTLYGRNSAGGAVKVITQSATDTLTAKLQTSVGNYDSVDLQGTVSGPINDNIKGRLSVMSRNSDGYVDIVGTPRDGFDTNRDMVRGKLEFALSDSTSLVVSADYGRVREGMWAMENSGQRIAQKHPSIAVTPTPGKFNEAYDFNGYQHSTTWGANARLESDLAFANFTSITSFRNSKLDEMNDFDASAADSIRRQFAEDSDAFQQELRLSSPDGGGPLTWVGGVYFFHENVDRLGQFFVGRDNQFAIGIGPFPGNGGRPFSSLDTRTIKNTSVAVFGQATYAVLTDLNLTAGARYSYDKKTMARSATTVGAPATGVNPFLSAPFTATAGKSWDSIDPAVIVDYHVADNAMLYGSYKLGYKAGGFQTDPVINAAAAQVIFNPETTESFEVGFKTDWLDRRLVLNGAAFLNNYDNLQFLRTISLGGGAFASLIDNVAKARAKGFELEVTALPFEGLSLSVGYAYLHSAYRTFVASDGRNLSGRQTSRSPESSLNFDASYAHPIGEGLLTFHTHVNYTSSYWFEGAGFAPYSLSKAYALVDGRISYDTADEQWRISLWGKNLTNQPYRTHNITIVIAPSPLTVASMDTYGRPRTFGVEVAWRYGK
ncbi:MAG: TonB-dependent receptor [Rhodospirillaceae bacterium]|nr:TonB-dependent receptor [Rhodospirillaceae bacterium]